ncbi:hypothetical protein SAMN05428642_10396 [Flaviramulus basaltis]|uniref:Uncharacterized protein n=1 Tax=Flaviramulus basaltis TaxID=369401 RepID=A0A1K2ILN0_9FLAO|nr:hypothetical protein [Flaviramulus basaltis]SFZ93373.1 hypothetical protein SAMN05428642_10396 [Flaviramulus basaltis]
MGKNKNSQSLLISLNIFATITAIVFAILSETDDSFDFISKWHIILGVFILYLIINFSRVIQFIDRIKSRIKFLLNIVIEYRRGHLEFIDVLGEEVMYNEECLFKRIRRKKVYTSSIAVDGKVDNVIHTYNCYNSLNHKNNIVTISYGKKDENKNIGHNKRQLQFGFVVILRNTFPKKTESWDTVCKHYTKVYDLKMSFSKTNPPRDVCLFAVSENSKGKEVLTPLDIDPLIMQKYNRVVMKIKLLHMQKGDKFRVKWTWDSPKIKKKDKKSKKPSKKKAS